MVTPSTVSGVMTRPVMTTRPDARLDEVARTLRQFHVSGLPVVDEVQRVVGVISEKDIARDLQLAAGVASPRGILDLLLESAPPGGEGILEVCRNRLHNARVRDAMTHPAITLREDAPISDVARLMRERSINRVPVVDSGGSLVGIVTREDLLAALGVRPHHEPRTRRPPPLVSRDERRSESDPFSDA